MELAELPGLAEVITFVHTSEYLSMAKELQSKINTVFTVNAKTWTGDEAFVEGCSRLPTMMKELLPQLAAGNETERKSDKAIIQDLSAVITGLENELETVRGDLARTKKGQATDSECWERARLFTDGKGYCENCGKGHNPLMEGKVGGIAVYCSAECS